MEIKKKVFISLIKTPRAGRLYNLQKINHVPLLCWQSYCLFLDLEVEKVLAKEHIRSILSIVFRENITLLYILSLLGGLLKVYRDVSIAEFLRTWRPLLWHCD